LLLKFSVTPGMNISVYSEVIPKLTMKKSFLFSARTSNVGAGFLRFLAINISHLGS